jgi:hypothetical protein
LSLYQQPDLPIKNDKNAYLTLLKIESLIPKNMRLEALKVELGSRLKASEIQEAESIISDWKPKVSPLTQQAMQGIVRSKMVAGVSIKN